MTAPADAKKVLVTRLFQAHGVVIAKGPSIVFQMCQLQGLLAASHCKKYKGPRSDAVVALRQK